MKASLRACVLLRSVEFKIATLVFKALNGFASGWRLQLDRRRHSPTTFSRLSYVCCTDEGQGSVTDHSQSPAHKSGTVCLLRCEPQGTKNRLLVTFAFRRRVWIRFIKESQLTQRGTRDGDACLKAHCKQNFSSRIPAVDIRHDDYQD